MREGYELSEWNPGSRLDADLNELSELLVACVHDGASVGFVLPFDQAQARNYWTNVLGDIQTGATRPLVVRQNEKIVGCVLLCLDKMPNQRHKANVSKLLVHPDHRRNGIARALMVRLEELANQENRWMLVLDTAGAEAVALYRSLGYELAGRIPDFAQHPTNPSVFDAAKYYFKRLA